MMAAREGPGLYFLVGSFDDVACSTQPSGLHIDGDRTLCLQTKCLIVHNAQPFLAGKCPCGCSVIFYERGAHSYVRFFFLFCFIALFKRALLGGLCVCDILVCVCFLHERCS